VLNYLSGGTRLGDPTFTPVVGQLQERFGDEWMRRRARFSAVLVIVVIAERGSCQRGIYV